jgi:hypothetical protein
MSRNKLRWNGFGAGWSARGKVERALVVQRRRISGLWQGVKRALLWSAVALLAGALLSGSRTSRRH